MPRSPRSGLGAFNPTLKLVLVSLALALGASCASIDPAPFQKFQTGAQKLRDGVQAPLKSEVDQARQRAVEDLVENPLELSGLQLQFGNPEFRWSYPENGPLFTTLETRNQAVRHLNDAFAAYAGLLLELASVQVVPEDQFDQQVQSINSSSRGFLSTLGSQPATGVTELLSIGFVEIARDIVVSEQHKRLKEAIEANQDTVESFSTAGAQLMSDVAAGIGTEYLDSFGELQSAFVEAGTGERPAALDPILQLNQRTQATLDLLGQLHASYQALPGAHQELATALSGGSTAHRIEDFLGRAARLAQLYESLEANDAASGSAGSAPPGSTPSGNTEATPSSDGASHEGNPQEGNP